MVKHVLIVDDDPGFRLLLRKTLEPAGYRVSESKNALEVFSLDPKSPPDVILLDIQMPGISGHKVLSSLKADPSFKIPVIVISGMSDPTHARSALAEGADAFLTKPIERDQLLAKISELLAQKEAKPAQ
jgi:CheY-like chemotaxis protein